MECNLAMFVKCYLILQHSSQKVIQKHLFIVDYNCCVDIFDVGLSEVSLHL